MKTLTIGLSGIEEQDLALFHTLFTSLRVGFNDAWNWADDTDERPTLLVIDIDTVYGHIDWLKATATGIRTALYTAAEYTNDADLILKKPLTPNALADVLARVGAEHGVKLDAVGAAAAVPVAAPAAVAAVLARNTARHAAAPNEIASTATVAATTVAKPAAKPAVKHAAKPVAKPVATPVAAKPVVATPLPKPEPKPLPAQSASAASAPAAKAPDVPKTVAAMLLARAADAPIALAVGEDEWVIDPERDAYHGPTLLKPLAEALRQPLASLKPVGVAALEQARKQPGQPLARLRWFAALSATPGRLAPTLDTDARYKLSRWPQIEREFPRHFRVATAMMKQSDRIDDIAAASGAPRSDVVDFINGYHALGYIKIENEAFAEVAESGRGVMSRIRKPFAR